MDVFNCRIIIFFKKCFMFLYNLEFIKVVVWGIIYEEYVLKKYEYEFNVLV